MIRCSVIGATGYTGAELVALLAAHEAVELAGLFGSDARTGGAETFADVWPRFRGIIDAPLEPASLEHILAAEPQVVFLATPHKVSHDFAPALLDRGITIFDLSAAFRLNNPAVFEQYYGFPHEHPELLKQAVYGLAEHYAAEIAEANLIAVPGCYPTSVALPVVPLIKAGLIDPAREMIADCTSGVSGAGRSPSLASQFCEVSYKPYGVFTHRHQPEINLHCDTDVIFTPHVAPFDRGIVSTIHATLANDANEAVVRDTLHTAYDGSPFVRLLPSGEWPSVAGVRHTNFCDIALAADSRQTGTKAQSHLILISAIDNLVKGAAGQAVQCFNIRFGFPETESLLPARKELTHVHA